MIEQVLVHEALERYAKMKRIAGRTDVPQIFIGDTHVGGYSEPVALDRSGDLDASLHAAGAG